MKARKLSTSGRSYWNTVQIASEYIAKGAGTAPNPKVSSDTKSAGDPGGISPSE